ncbi:hypothetical protein TOK_4718 [Pseudonocardia sp. N23]|nr:hypothetical protein TOK_4718 [Pseudonocardia sp. N23]
MARGGVPGPLNPPPLTCPPATSRPSGGPVHDREVARGFGAGAGRAAWVGG